MILPLQFQNEAAVYPYFATPLVFLGLNGRKKKKMRKHVEAKDINALTLSPFTGPLPSPSLPRLAALSPSPRRPPWRQLRVWGGTLPAPPRHPLPCELQRAVFQPLRAAKTRAESNPCARQEAGGFLLLRAAGSGCSSPSAPIQPQGKSRLSVAPSTSTTMEEQRYSFINF